MIVSLTLCHIFLFVIPPYSPYPFISPCISPSLHCQTISYQIQLQFDASLFPDVPELADASVDEQEGAIDAALSHLRTECELSFVGDVVLNHTANDSAWIRAQPEAGTKVANSDIKLCFCIYLFICQIGYNALNDEHGSHLRAALELDRALREHSVAHHGHVFHDKRAVEALVGALFDHHQLFDRIQPHFRGSDDELRDHLAAARNGVIERVCYERLAEHGPKSGALSESAPLVAPYFTEFDNVALAHNGWLWGGDAEVNFAAPEAGGRVYLRRELIVWADSIKLRYGSCRKDNEPLWQVR